MKTNITYIFLALFCLQEIAIFRNSFTKIASFCPLAISAMILPANPRTDPPSPPPPKIGPINHQRLLARSSLKDRYKVEPLNYYSPYPHLHIDRGAICYSWMTI